jgi:hypothetical protein
MLSQRELQQLTEALREYDLDVHSPSDRGSASARKSAPPAPAPTTMAEGGGAAAGGRGSETRASLNRQMSRKCSLAPDGKGGLLRSRSMNDLDQVLLVQAFRGPLSISRWKDGLVMRLKTDFVVVD